MSKYLFILCSHSSGSTALWKLLQTSPQVSALPVEGQFIETVEPIMRASIWDPDKLLPWPRIKAEWDRIWDLEKPVLVEKSPPNLLQALEIQRHFPNSHFIVMVRNPYAYCEGTKRRGRAGLGYGPQASYEQIAAGWVRECQRQIDNIKGLGRVILFTYEQFTRDPDGTAGRIRAFIPDIGTLDTNTSFMIHSLHGWFERSVTNLNAMQIARLSKEDIKEINHVLKSYPEVMAFFGYRYREHAFNGVDRLRLTLSNFYLGFVVRNLQRVSRRAKQAAIMAGILR